MSGYEDPRQTVFNMLHSVHWVELLFGLILFIMDHVTIYLKRSLELK